MVRGSYLDPGAPPRAKRPLRTSDPVVHSVTTEDGKELRLTRYRGGSRGPVILSHGLGVSSEIFTTDTIATNLVEYLFANGHDLWLLDYRASIDLPTSHEQHSADDVARFDYPAAVEKVLEATGADSVQMVVHCYGSTAWTISMLKGHLRYVRSAVCSQVSTHMKTPSLTRLKTGLHLPSFLDKLGIESLTAYVDRESGWLDKTFDTALRLYPIEEEERCASEVCRRITFLYGHLYEHDKLSETTHENLHEMFGVASVKHFEHLAVMVRNGHVTDFEGKEDYLAHVERMAIPITFLSGEENQCFLPESTEITYNLLREENEPELYERHVIPGYGHIDCIFGENAAEDVFPFIEDHLSRES